MAVLFTVQPFVFAQINAEPINENEAKRIISFLADDSLKGRGNGSKELFKAGLFIGDEFKKSGLQVLTGYPGYYFPFRPFGGSNKIISDELVWNGKKLLTDQFMYLHPEPGNYPSKKLTDFTVIKLDSFFTEDILLRHKDIQNDLLLWSNLPQPDKENYFPSQIMVPEDGLKQNVLLVCANHAPDSIFLSGVNSYYSNVEYNVVGMLRGKSRPQEIIMFSAHYDHEGVFQRGRKKDSILNGANDNASGTTALLMLAKHFVQQNNNDRTLLFCAFAGEELGLLGSKDFANIIPAPAIVAGINIEMIGVQGYGKNGVFITGFDQSTLPAILKKQFSATTVQVKAEPSGEKELFRRSDNYSFVKKGVPAHSIMSSDDDDKCYHQPCDELKRINIPHLTNIVKAIAIATKTLISGEDTPSRITVSDK
jgi:hypothetical protein